MQYSRRQFFALMEEIESQGGEYLDEIHEHQYIPELCGGKVPEELRLARNCNEPALFMVPYESSFAGAQSEVKVCAKDDMLGLWPRFAAANATG